MHMKRTQIYLDQEIFNSLMVESKQYKKTISELIRDRIKDSQKNKVDNIQNAMENIKGLWQDKDIDVDKYIRDLRIDRIVNDND